MTQQHNEKIENLKLLIKFLGMTRSANNAEALVAIRKANEHLDKYNVTWEEFCNGAVKITVVEDPFKNVPPPPASKPFDPTQATMYMRRPSPSPVYTAPVAPAPKSSIDPLDLHMTQAAKRLAESGDIIGAIKEIRSAFNHLGFVGLKEAKDLVDNYVKTLAKPKPAPRPAPAYDPFVAKPTPSGATRQTPRTNQYPGVCHKCGTRVAGGAGILDGRTASGQYRIACAPGQCKTSKYAKTHIDLDDLANMTS